MTHIGFNIGSIVDMRQARRADVLFMPFEKKIYANPTWTTPKKITAIHAPISAVTSTNANGRPMHVFMRKPINNAFSGFVSGLFVHT
jgi:hypothetical protein